MTKAERSIEFLNRHNIPFEETDMKNIVLTTYWGTVHYIGLTGFHIAKGFMKPWIVKRKTMIMTLTSKFKTGRYKGKTLAYVYKRNPKYIKKLMDEDKYIFKIPNLYKTVYE